MSEELSAAEVANRVATRREGWIKAEANRWVNDAAEKLEEGLRRGTVHHVVASVGRINSTIDNPTQRAHDREFTMGLFRKALREYVNQTQHLERKGS